MNQYPVKSTAPIGHLTYDVVDAATSWGFNCGPAALCACLGMTPEQLRPHLLDFEERKYTSPSMMNAILDRLRAPYKLSSVPVGSRQAAFFGLVRVQFSGPWMRPEVPVAAQYKHTHWVASQFYGGQCWIFDINAFYMAMGERAGWVPALQWSHQLLPNLLRVAVPRADGKWWFTHLYEIDAQRWRMMDGVSAASKLADREHKAREYYIKHRWSLPADRVRAVSTPMAGPGGQQLLF